MLVSLNWLKEYVDLPDDVDELARRLTMLGLEIERIARPGEEIQQVYVGEIEAIDPHPDADRLVVCRTRIGGDEPLQIVCGAKNMQVGDKVPTAVVGGTLPGGFAIARRKMRGVESQGMMCSARELGLGNDHSGLMILAPDLPLGADVRPLLGLDDVIFEIEVTPNRGDWASMIGVARELAALYDTPLRMPETVVEEGPTPVQDCARISIEAPELCPRYCGRVLRNVTIKPSPAWLAQRLLAAGQRPVNNVVDVTNYVLLETGHPLHAFDFDRLSGDTVRIRRAAADEPMTTLDHEERRLHDETLVIADDERPQCIAGVMGGVDSEVGESTRTVFLESAVFDPVSVRRTSRRYGLFSESSQRFQRGADPDMARFALDRAAALIQDVAGGDVAQGVLDEYPRPAAVRELRLRYARTDAILGIAVAPGEQRRILERLGFEVLGDDETGSVLEVPSWRHDVTLEADLIEEIGRLYGYDKIPATYPRVRPTGRVYAPHDAQLRRLKDCLAGLGLSEVRHWTFSSAEDTARAGLPEHYQDLVLLENPLSERQAGMRTSLLPGLLDNVARNRRHGSPDLALFEIGPVYFPQKEEPLPLQETRLGIALSGTADARHWSRTPREVDFYDLKGYIEALGTFFSASLTLEAADHGPLAPGQAAGIRMDHELIGHIGAVAPGVRKAFDLDEAVFVAELRLDPLLQREAPAASFQAIPSYPASLRDMALVVDGRLPAGELIATAQQVGGKHLVRVEIFDIYTGKPIPEGRKSVALGLRFQSPERTLTDKDTQKAWDKILKRLQQEHGAELR